MLNWQVNPGTSGLCHCMHYKHLVNHDKHYQSKTGRPHFMFGKQLFRLMQTECPPSSSEIQGNMFFQSLSFSTMLSSQRLAKAYN